jgi:hypothetical protein
MDASPVCHMMRLNPQSDPNEHLRPAGRRANQEGLMPPHVRLLSHGEEETLREALAVIVGLSRLLREGGRTHAKNPELVAAVNRPLSGVITALSRLLASS